MGAGGRIGNIDRTARVEERGFTSHLTTNFTTNFPKFKLAPIARAIALIVTAGGAIGSGVNANAAQPFSAGWYGAMGVNQHVAAATGMVNGKPASAFNPAGQQQAANTQLQKSIDNLTLAAHGIAMMQAQQASWRKAALGNPSNIPNGLGVGGLDTGSLAASWINAIAPTTQTTDANGNIVVDIQQTADKAIANWETFNIGKNTIVQFDQASSDWAILNRITDPSLAASTIQGQIRAPGTVLIVNKNGIVFNGSSQINVRNLVAAAADISNSQFTGNGIYGADAATPTFTNALGKLEIQAGAQIVTSEPQSVTDGGGYVLLLGHETSNAGEITTRKGQTLLAAGDSFVIRKGVGTAANQYSTVRGNEVMPQFIANSTAGAVDNSGIVIAREGDVTLAGHEVRQQGVAVASTTVNTRGTIHLLNSATDATGSVTLGAGSLSAVLIEDDGATTALDSQRDALIKDSATQDQQRINAAAAASSTKSFDNYSTLSDRRDLSRIEIVGGGNVNFEGDSLALATGGQLAVSSGNSAAGTKDGAVAFLGAIHVDNGAALDVSGSVGVKVSMDSNNIKVNVQGNELRDAPLNRDAGKLFNSNLWIDKRDLILVPAGTDGYESDRWYTAGGLLEVSGYLGNQGHGIGEWSAQGGTVNLTGDSVVAQAGARINLSGGSLDVATGRVKTTWLKGSDGRLYTADNAPADLLYGLPYVGFEVDHPRWGFTERFYNPLIAPQSHLENGYTVGRDAGKLEIWSSDVRFDAHIDADVYNGPRQTMARPDASTLTDAYKLSQKQAALAGRLLIQTYDPSLGINSGSPRLNRIGDVRIDDTEPADTVNNVVWLNLDRINEAGLGGLTVDTRGNVSTGGDLTLAPGGALDLRGAVTLGGSLTARGGSIRLAGGLSPYGELLDFVLGDGVTIDTRGLWTNEMLDIGSAWGLAFINGGSVQISASGAMALESGSRIDTSGGGAILANGKTQGGNGGDVSLTAGGLVIDGGGVIAAHGFGKGGKLSITTPAAISIGGPLTQTSGVLAAGEAAPFDLTVSEDFVLPAGYVLPTDMKISTGAFILPGKKVPAESYANIPFNKPLVVGANGWTNPMDAVYAKDSPTGTQAYYPPNSFIPPGYLVTAINSPFPAGYVLPAGAFVAPVPIYVVNTPYAAGTVLAQPLTVTAGTVLTRGMTMPVTASVLPVFEIDNANAFFQQGFSSYNLSGSAGLIVQPGTQVNVAMPLYSFTGKMQPQGLAGDALAQAVELVLPPLFADDPVKNTLKQRAGADISLTGGVAGVSVGNLVANPLTDGAAIVGEGAAISVDPGHRISLTSKGQVDVEGSLIAPGGSISVINSRTMADVEVAHRILFPNDYSWTSDDPADALSVWIGGHAVLDAAGRAYTASDVKGNTYGVVLDGGSVLLGGPGGSDPGTIGGVLSSASYVVVRPGASIDVSGASADLNLSNGRGSRAPREVASNGGAITVSSYDGFFLDGDMRAQAGGAGASGGSLSLVLESPTYANVYDGSTRSGRVLYVAQDSARLLPDNLDPGQLDAAFVPAQAHISAEQIGQGGFDSLSLWSRTAIAFDGDVNLHLGRSLALQQGSLYQTTAGADVNLSAPYISFDGGTLIKGTSNGQFWPAPTRLPTFADGGTFSVDADLIDLRNAVRTNFDETALHSTGDMRFLVSTAPPPDASLNDGGIGTTELRAAGDIELTAAQIYPASGAVAKIAAGGLTGLTNGEPSRIVIGSGSAESGAPAQPYSLFGSLTLSAGTIEQGGVVRAPFGTLAFNAAQEVDLLPGSITSISTDGLTMPFGGTVDGVTYTYNGATAPAPELLAGGWSGTFSVGGTTQNGIIGLTILSPVLHSEAGSVLDVSGGGHLTGGAFVTGRGGSVDTLLAPLNPGGKVYALVPGTTVAPTPGGYYNAWNGAVPNIGQQITLPDGVPGLPGGTYTLMPANYALLPGAWRVELGGRTGDLAGALKLPNGSYAVSGVQGIANTDIRDSLSTMVTLTSGQVLRTYSTYNEQGYSQFQSARAQTFGTQRPLLEADGKRLEFDALVTAGAPASSALVFDGSADFSAGQGGLPGNFTLLGTTGVYNNQTTNKTLVITGPGSATANDADTITVSGAEIAKVNAPNLYLGGAIKGPTNIDMNGWAGTIMLDYLTVESGVRLTGGQVVLGANQKVTLQENASIDTLGWGQTALDSSAGLLFGAQPSNFGSSAVLLVSNGQFTMNAPSGLFGSNIELRDGVSLYSEGTIGFYSDLGVSLIGTPNIGTRNLSLAVPSFNIGTDAALAAAQTANGSLPAGMNLNQRILDALFAGRPAAGVPAIENLSLSAGKSINFFGSVDLNTIDPATGKSRLAQFTLNTPALYGYGGAGDTVRLIADTLVWTDTARSVVSQDVYGSTYGSTPPGAPIAGALGGGKFEIDANRIVIGNSAPSLPDTSIAYNRLMLGFSDVYFNAAERVTGNAKNTLSVYRSGADPSTAFDPATYAGVGGNLHLNTPLLTGDPASVIGYYAGGNLSVTAPAGSAGAAAANQVGATLDLHAQSIDIASAIVLPSGKLTLTADQGITLADGALLDVSGRRLTFFDVTRDTWGGDIAIESRHGNIVQGAGAAIDISAANSDAGTLKLAALEGSVLAGGDLRGSGAENHGDGAIDLRALSIGGGDLSADFAALNTKLSDAGFFGARSFDLRQGNLVIGDELRAHNVNVSVDGGSLTVDGRIDASSATPGSIRLAARDDVRLAGAAVLDAHGTVLQVDSYGQPIEAANRGAVELASTQGWLRLDDGATMDVSAPNAAYGRVALQARRADETGGDVLIDASGRVNIVGARSIAVNAFWTYSPTDADGTIMQDNGSAATVNGSGEVGLNQIDTQNQIFYGNALGNGALQTRLAGLKAYGAAYHLRPGVEITSTGTLTVKGDINLAGFRYGPDADTNPGSLNYGAGEPLALSLRAAGDLNIKGSITDGFGMPNASPDDSPILLNAGQTLNADYTLPENVTLAIGTKLGVGTVLPFNVTLQGGQVLRAGQAAAGDITLHPTDKDAYGNLIYGFGGVDAYGQLLYPIKVLAGRVDDWNYNGDSFGPGSVFEYALGDDAKIYAGTILQALNGAPVSFADLVITPGARVAANKALPQQVTLDANYTLAAAMRATGVITTPGQTYTAGMTIPAGTVLPQGTTVGVGAALPFDFDIQATTWLAGNPFILTSGYTLTSTLNLAAGAVLPAGTSITSTVYSGNTRPVWAVAPMLAAGSESASIRLVGGADLNAADTRILQSAAALHGNGNIALNDPRVDNSSNLPIFSVVRTGTGDLDLLAGGSLTQATPFGVYTAGTQSDLPGGNAAFNLPRASRTASTPSITGLSAYDDALNAQATWYPDHGGDLLIDVQHDLGGNVWHGANGFGNDEVAAWLWRQGADGMGIAPAWSINFGTYVSAGTQYDPVRGQSVPIVRVVGFNGYGALGGGNATLLVDGNAGSLISVNPYASEPSTSALMVAVGSTGRVTGVNTSADGAVTGGTLVQTGGGNLTMKIGGALNGVQPVLSNSDTLQGTLADLRGDMDVSAGAIGSMTLKYGVKAAQDPRGVDLYTAQSASQYQTGPVLVPGDGEVNLRSRGDLVMGQYQDAAMLTPRGNNSNIDSLYSFQGNLLANGRAGVDYNWFTLWTPDTAISMLSAGGNLMPFAGTGNFIYLPPKFDAVAASGNIYYGSDLSNQTSTAELLPSATGQLNLLAAGSIYATRDGGLSLGMSGARAGIDDLPNPFKPAWIMTQQGGNLSQISIDPACLCGTNTLLAISPPLNPGDPSTYSPRFGYFAFQAGDTPTTLLHEGDADPIRLYAVEGDIVGAVLGRVIGASRTTPIQYLAAKAAQVRAGRDIVGFGLLNAPGNISNAGSFIMNANATDVSVIEAGRDIFYANVNVAGPGTLEVTAGRNMYQGDSGGLVSLGAIVPGDARLGADIAVTVGAGAAGPDYAAMKRYLDAANQADLTAGHPLADQPGKVAHSYQDELIAWLKDRYGYEAAGAQDALSHFDTLAPEQQNIFLRTVYFAELRAGGREYNEAGGPRFGSYLRGRQAIAAMFPVQGNEGQGGDYTQFGPSGIQTRFGGDIQMLAPDGKIIVGTQGPVPPASSGVITQGAGDIELYSQGSILLGLSRIMTTFGGGILAWSAQGDINAGLGSKTTLIYTPPKREYDNVGDVTLSPQAPSSGAGIATLAPIPEVPAGDVYLIAPLGTIDAGEAGIRVSGDLYIGTPNLINGENITVKGKSTGLPLLASVNIGALTNAGAAASQAAIAAQDVVNRERNAARQALPSIFTVRVLSFGNEPAPDSGAAKPSSQSGQQGANGYDQNNRVQVLGHGEDMKAELLSRLSSEERRKLQQDR